MSTYNRDRFYYSQFDNALEAYRLGDLESPDNICRSLVSEFEVPRVVQARAYQLLSFCAGDEYWLARSYLERGLQVSIIELPSLLQITNVTIGTRKLTPARPPIH